MPAVSRAQQRLMQAAEHGATFPKAKKLRASMSHQSLHDFATGSMQGKPAHVRYLHPALAQRAAHVKAAHAHLTKTVPGFAKLPMPEKMRLHQAHIRTRYGR